MNRKQRRAEKKDGADALALHADGVQAFVSGHPDKAARLIAQAIAADGEKPDFHYNLAIVLKAQGKLKQAAASYQRAIALKPDYAEAHNNLGNVWKDLGEPDKARASFERALAISPGNPGTHYSLGLLCGDDSAQAASHFRLCLENDPQDSRGAAILLARMGVGVAPEKTSQAQLLKIYDVRSRFWDQESGYFAPGLIADAFRAHAPPEKINHELDILDIGCGTGLVGSAVRASARRLDGVDLSQAMLEKAKAKGLYDRLEQADIVDFLSTHKDSYDAVLGAAVLIHFGDLSSMFTAAAASLRENGLFLFTLFAADDSDFSVAASDRLAQSGCYTHSAAYIERLAPQSGFSIVELKQVVHEHDQDGRPVPGLLVLLRREKDF